MNYTIFFTNQCNMDCTYCYECNKMVRSTSYDVLDGIVNFIVEKQRSCSDKTVSIVTHGGEPLIEFDKIQYFIKRLNEKVKNVQYIITTNATLLTDLMIDFLSQHYSEISVSIDGIQSAHDANRVFANKKGSYAVVVEKAKKLLEKRSDVKARMTINPQTASTLYESVKHLLDLGFTTIVPVIDTFCNDWTEKDMEILLDAKQISIMAVNEPNVLAIRIKLIHHLLFPPFSKFILNCGFPSSVTVITTVASYILPVLADLHPLSLTSPLDKSFCATADVRLFPMLSK